jgi:serine O-acetyltransferase
MSQPESERAMWRAIRAQHPHLREALLADARLAWVSDAFLGQAMYRIKARLQALGVPVLPRIAHRLAMVTAQISIGDPVIVHPGVYIIHGQVVADGLVEIHSGVAIAPWVTIGLRGGDVRGATVEPGVSIGTGAKIIGPVRIGAGAQIGANAVVVDDVAPGATVVGAPARPLHAAH